MRCYRNIINNGFILTEVDYFPITAGLFTSDSSNALKLKSPSKKVQKWSGVKFINKKKETTWHFLTNQNQEFRLNTICLWLASIVLQDKRNFLRDPPAGVQFHFDVETMYPVALVMLQEDELLNRMRFDLVPKQWVRTRIRTRTLWAAGRLLTELWDKF